MTWQFTPNVVNNANGGAHAIVDLKALLLASGGTIYRSGGGTGSGLYSAVADVVTTSALLNVSRAWFILLWNGIYFYFQRGSSGNTFWWIRCSYAAPTLGTSDEDDMPTAADTQDLHGTTNAGSTLFSAAASYHHHIGCDNAAPGGFYVLTLFNGTGNGAGGLCFDPLAAASYPVEDTAPWIWFSATTSNFGSATNLAGSSGPKAWFCRGLAGEPAAPSAVIPTPAANLSSTSYGSWHDALGTNPYSGDDDRLPISYGRPAGAASQIGFKGHGTVMRWIGPNRANGDTNDNGATIDHVCVEQISLPFDNVVCAI